MDDIMLAMELVEIQANRIGASSVSLPQISTPPTTLRNTNSSDTIGLGLNVMTLRLLRGSFCAKSFLQSRLSYPSPVPKRSSLLLDIPFVSQFEPHSFYFLLQLIICQLRSWDFECDVHCRIKKLMIDVSCSQLNFVLEDVFSSSTSLHSQLPRH